MITQEQLKERLYYNQQFGIFVWKKNIGSGAAAGAIAGCLDRVNGYILIGIDKKMMSAHRLAFLYMNGDLPENEVDHRNRIRSDNTWSNLRLCTHQQNQQNKSMQKNNKSGVKGVHWVKKAGKWRAQIKHDGKIITVGLFDDLENASRAIKEKRTELHGEYASHH